MGQYYMIVNINKKKYIHPHAIPSKCWCYGVKLMEHSFWGSAVVRSVESLICPGGDWYMDSLVWAGDYADDEPGYCIEDEKGNRTQANLHKLCTESAFATMEKNLDHSSRNTHYRYIVNHDTNEYVDTAKRISDDDAHPLPLLIVEGNGRGGGDYRGGGNFHDHLVGAWARNRVTVQDEKPTTTNSEGKTFHQVPTNDYAWNRVGHVVLLRRLVDKGRAQIVEGGSLKNDGEDEVVAAAHKRPRLSEDDSKGSSTDNGGDGVQKFIAGLKEELFRHVLSFLC